MALPFLDFICLWCNDRGRTFYSLDAVRKHMNDKGHCKLLHEGLALAEYAEYYDYSSSYPDNVSFCVAAMSRGLLIRISFISGARHGYR